MRNTFDQCGTCTVKGDYEKCISVLCSHHETWYAKQMVDEIERLKSIILNLCAELERGDERQKLIAHQIKTVSLISDQNERIEASKNVR
jgi:hypothetical protein